MTMRSTILAAGVAAAALAGCSTMETPSRDQLVAEPSACDADPARSQTLNVVLPETLARLAPILPFPGWG